MKRRRTITPDLVTAVMGFVLLTAGLAATFDVGVTAIVAGALLLAGTVLGNKSDKDGEA